MSASIPGPRDLPLSRHDLTTYRGRVLHASELCDPRTLFTSSAGLENAKSLLASYKNGHIQSMTPQLWEAKKVVDATLHPDTGTPIFLPLRMSSYVFSNLIVTAGMLQPSLGTRGVLAWQVTNQTLNVLINSANANKTSPLPWSQLSASFLLAVGSSCGVALGLRRYVENLRVKAPGVSGGVTPGLKMILGRLVPFAAVVTAGVVNVGFMRGGEIARGIEVYPTRSEKEGRREALGKSRIAAGMAVAETALSRVINATPIMVLPPLLLVRLQKGWLSSRPGWTVPVNIGLIFLTSVFALPPALGLFPQRQKVKVDSLEPEFHGRGGDGGLVEFNRGM